MIIYTLYTIGSHEEPFPANFNLKPAEKKEAKEHVFRLLEKIKCLAKAIFTYLFMILDEMKRVEKDNFHKKTLHLPQFVQDRYAVEFAKENPREGLKFLTQVATYNGLVYKASLHMEKGEEAEAILSLDRAMQATSIPSKIKGCEQVKQRLLVPFLKREPKDLKEQLLHIKYKPGISMQVVEDRFKALAEGNIDYLLNAIDFLTECEWQELFISLTKGTMPHCVYAAGLYGHKRLVDNPIAQYREGLRLYHHQVPHSEELDYEAHPQVVTNETYFRLKGIKLLKQSAKAGFIPAARFLNG